MLRYVWIEGWQQIFRIFILYDREKQEKEKIVNQTWLYGKKKIFSAIRQQ